MVGVGGAEPAGGDAVVGYAGFKGERGGEGKGAGELHAGVREGGEGEEVEEGVHLEGCAGGCIEVG